MPPRELVREQLVRASVDTFGDLGFLLADSLEVDGQGDEPIASVGEAVAVVQIPLRGAIAGSLLLQVTQGVLESLSVNMLALDTPPDEGTQRDALAEVLNVLVGKFILDLEEAGHEVGMGLPAFDAGEDDAPRAAQVRLHFLEGWADVALVWHGPVGVAA